MNIQIIVHSKTGTTFRLGEIISDKLMQDGHTVNLTTLQTAEPVEMNPRTKQQYKFTNLPKVGNADVVLFGGPVWAFRPSPVICAAMQQLGVQYKGKKVIPFITQGFPFAWMTGKGSLNSLARIAGTQGAKLLPGAVLTGRAKGKTERMEAIAEAIRKALK